MAEEFKFIYHKEYWYLSAFINTDKIDIEKKIVEIESLITQKLKNLERSDLSVINWNPDLQDKIIELGKNISIDCQWISHIARFPYFYENLHREFNALGSFQFEVEYFKDKNLFPKEKEKIEPIMIQQIPELILEVLKDYSNRIENKYLYIDKESKIYIFTISKETQPKDTPKWTPQNISKYKEVIGFWTEIYSGSWDDYSDTLFENRCKNNLSNRESELHFIRRNSGFIYMAEDNFNKFFAGYMMEKVLKPTAKIRALSFALLTIDDSLDALSHQERIELTQKEKESLDEMIAKLDEQKKFREMIQEQMSLIFDELVIYRRQHYTSVLEHLIKDFRIEKTYERITKKFEMIHASIENISLQHQKRLKQSMERLNILIVAGVIADIVSFILGAYVGQTDNMVFILNVSSLSLMLLFLAYVIYKIYIAKFKSRKREKLKAVLAIIPRENEKVIVTQRKNWPFKGLYSLPGCLINKNEDSEEAIKKEVKEETGLIVDVTEKLAESIYDPKRPDIKTTTFLCKIKSVCDPNKIVPGGNALKVEWKPINELTYRILAFDHTEFLDKFKNKFKI